MKTEKEMMDMILRIAREDDRIRAVYMCGSRCNPNASRDIFQDYDIVYVVRETESFIRDKAWPEVFGERLLMQLPMELDRIAGEECHFDREYAYLIQLRDGNRVDCVLRTIQAAGEDITANRLNRILLDKDGCLPEIPEASDEGHWVKCPGQEEYSRCCNEFWWLLLNVGKGLWREELTYVMEMLNQWVRPESFRMLSWYAGTEHGFSFSAGKGGKYLWKFLPESLWNAYLDTYPECRTNRIWEAVERLCNLFSGTARKVGQDLEVSYDTGEEEASRYYLRRVKALPREAGRVFDSDSSEQDCACTGQKYGPDLRGTAQTKKKCLPKQRENEKL